MDKAEQNKDRFDRFNDKEMEQLEIPEQGFIGLLAYGDLGLLAWRKARDIKIYRDNGEAIKTKFNDEE